MGQILPLSLGDLEWGSLDSGDWASLSLMRDKWTHIQMIKGNSTPMVVISTIYIHMYRNIFFSLMGKVINRLPLMTRINISVQRLGYIVLLYTYNIYIYIYIYVNITVYQWVHRNMNGMHKMPAWVLSWYLSGIKSDAGTSKNGGYPKA